MPNPELEKYINSAREQKVSDEVIKSQLVKSGWSETDVLEAIAPQTTGEINLPPPPVPHFGMWVTFQYVILFISLYVSAVSLRGILDHAVDKFIPDKLARVDYWGESLLRGYSAALLVSFPIFLVLFLISRRQVLDKPAIRNLRARKILIYITMVVAVIAIMTHSITIIYGLLGGVIKMNSFAHLGVTFLITGSIFFYLLNEVREDRKSS